jgi:predicted dehydrogenase
VGQKVIRVGVVGCGVVAAAYYLLSLMRMGNVEVAAVCDRNLHRARQCVRLFGARQAFDDYDEMIRRADIEAVFVLTGPGTHVPFALTAVRAGKHVLLQKPMATTPEGAHAITEAVRTAGVKAVIEPSSSTLLDEDTSGLRDLIERGVLGDPYYFAYVPIGPDHYHPSLGGNPYGAGAFYDKDSGGMLFDFPYGPTQIVSLLGPCRSVMASARISVPERTIVPDARYDAFLERATDPDAANYWDAVLDEPRTATVRMEGPDNVFSIYEMAAGMTGVYHVGRLFHPMPPGSNGGGLEIFGTEGNLVFGRGPHQASLISRRRDLLPSVDADGWYHVPRRGDISRAKWPQPVPGAFNYYHESSRHFIECIREDRDPLINVEWGRHITEMMYGALVSSQTGRRYDMTTTTTGLVPAAGT